MQLAVWLVALTAIVIWGQLLRKKERNLMGMRKTFYLVSGILCLLSLGAILFRGLQWGLDFTGGTSIELSSPTLLTAKAVRDLVEGEPGLHGEKLFLADVQVQVSAEMLPNLGPAGEPHQKIVVRVTQRGPAKNLETEQIKLVKAVLTEKLKLAPLSHASIGATVTSEIRTNAFQALAITLVLQLFYIFFRFGSQMRFGVAADVKLIHDLLILVGIYSLAGRQVDAPFIAALLTVTGYSVMDAVIIFDRIRENQRTTNGTSFEEVVNRSVNQTMTRSINATLTPVLTLLAIFYFGGSTLQNFAFALLLGIVTGACSSITLASPLLIEIDSWARKREQQKLALRRQLAATRAAAGHPVPVVAEEDDDPVERAILKGAGRTKRSGRRR